MFVESFGIPDNFARLAGRVLLFSRLHIASMQRFWYRSIVVCSIGLLLSLPSSAVAQSDGLFGIPKTGVSGSAGMMAQTYGSDGIASRRPTARSEVYADVSFSLLGARTGLNLLYSTESNDLRQSMNRLGFQWSWKWGEVEAGSVSPQLSEYSLNGETLRGGAIEITPGPFRIGAAGGQAQRAVGPSSADAFRQASYERWLYAGSFGVGSPDETYATLIGTYARDLASSLSDATQLRPSENATITPDVGVSLFQDRVQWQTEVTLSAYARDTRRSSGSLLNLLTNPSEPRPGSQFDYASRSELRLRLHPFRLNASYERIQPGFRSLGLSRIRSDQESIRIRPRLSFWTGRLSVGLTFQQTNNNLIDQRSTTRRRRRIGGNVQARLSRRLTLSGSYHRMAQQTEAAGSDSLSQLLERRFVTHVVSLTPSFTLRAGSVSHTLSVSGNYQRFTDDPAPAPPPTSPGSSLRRPDASSNNVTTTATYALTLPSGLSLSLSGNYLRNAVQGATTTAYGTDVSAGYPFFDRSLRLNLSVGWSKNRNEPTAARERWMRQLLVNSTVTYRLPFGDEVRLSVRGLSNQALRGRGRDYTEGYATLRYSHQF
jgi:hypothetical protein